ncbi:J-type co-chaperone JAC1, mitochondrial [Nakaseomyces bracarensis]|uniref:J-type co-chaperone JAC1, mitochondrial n=1 Tax=Nakaseomyces bracarensis TaxID=273131 RepID=A0ABR4NZS0_9SACH
MIRALLLRRPIAQGLVSKQTRRFISNYYELFPETFPNKDPQWQIDQSKLRKEYRSLQAEVHPDKLNQRAIVNGDSDKSSLLNKAYHTLKDPLTRSQHLLQVLKDIDLTVDSVAREVTQMDPDLLMEVLEVHEQLMEASKREEVKAIEKENKARIEQIESELASCYENNDLDKAVNLTAGLKYWKNVAVAIKDWSPGKTIELQH